MKSGLVTFMAILGLATTPALAQNSVSLQTYYPAPSGNYDKLIVNDVNIGNEMTIGSTILSADGTGLNLDKLNIATSFTAPGLSVTADDISLSNNVYSQNGLRLGNSGSFYNITKDGNGMYIRSGTINRMFLDNNGNIGIGSNTTLSGKLHVDGNLHLSSNPRINMEIGSHEWASGVNASGNFVVDYDSSLSDPDPMLNISSGGATTLNTSLVVNAPSTASPLTLNTNNTTSEGWGPDTNGYQPLILLGATNGDNYGGIYRSRRYTPQHIGFDFWNNTFANKLNIIFQEWGGNVGIGTPSPSHRLEVYGDGSTNEIAIQTNSWIGAWGISAARMKTFTIDSVDTYGDAASTLGGSLWLQGAKSSYGNWNINMSEDQLRFHDGTNVYLAMDPDGNKASFSHLLNVGIGEWNPTEKLVVAGNALVNGEITATGGYFYSDETLKKDVTNIEDAVSKVKKLNGVNFTWKESDKKDIGLIAQNVEKTFPELIKTNNEGIKSVSYSNIVAVLIEAVKEQQIQIDELTKQLDQMKGQQTAE